MIFTVRKADRIVEYYLQEIDFKELNALKNQITEKYSKIVHCEYIDRRFPMESDKIRNVKVEEYGGKVEDYMSRDETPLFKIEADFLTVPPVIDIITGVMLGSGKSLTDLMSLDAKKDSLLGAEILDDLRAISQTVKSGENTPESIVPEVISLSDKVITSDQETEELYNQLKSCVKVRQVGIRPVMPQNGPKI